MTQLRNFGIYKVPGIEHGLFSIRVQDDKYLLYDNETRGLPPRLAVLPNGLITDWFLDFPLCTIDELIDTGKTKRI